MILHALEKSIALFECSFFLWCSRTDLLQHNIMERDRKLDQWRRGTHYVLQLSRSCL
jgi:hypothetical protein